MHPPGRVSLTTANNCNIHADTHLIISVAISYTALHNLQNKITNSIFHCRRATPHNNLVAMYCSKHADDHASIRLSAGKAVLALAMDDDNSASVRENLPCGMHNLELPRAVVRANDACCYISRKCCVEG